MKLLLDTNALLWWEEESPRLGINARAAIRAGDIVYVSAASAWDAEIRRAKGKLMFPFSFTDIVASNGFSELPVSMRYAAATSALPPYHSDPFDRMLVAQALVEGCTLVTSDIELAAYGVPILDARS